MRIDTDTIRVLHVDDRPEFADIASEFLERTDDRIEVTSANSAREGLDRLASENFDCIVSDYEMPGADGLEFLEDVRSEHGDVPFILFTGKGSEEVASDAISAGVTDYLQKSGGTDQYTVLANRVVNAVDRRRSRRALEQSRNRLASLFEQSPLAVVEWNEDFEVVRWNRQASEVFGYTAEEAKGNQVPFIVPEHDHDHVVEVKQQLFEGEGGYHSINENVRKDGEIITCEWHNRVVTDENGEVQSVISLAQDVTERDRRKRRLETLIDTLPGIVYRETNQPDSPMQYVGGECERITGHTAEEIESGAVTWGEDVVHPDDRERVWEAIQEEIANGESFELTYDILTADGECKRVWERGQGIGDGKGGVRALEGFITDVTHHTDREWDLQREVDRMERALRGTGTAIWEWNVETDRIARHGVAELLETDPETLDDTIEALLERVHPEDRDRVRDVYESVAADPDSYRVEFRVLTDEGETRWIVDRGQGWTGNAGGNARLVGCFTDVTEARKREEDLRFRESLLEAQSEATREGVVVVDSDGEVVSYNERFLEMWDLTEDDVEDGLETAIGRIAEKVVDSESFRERTERSLSNPSSSDTDDPELIERTDGGRVQRYSVPIEDDDEFLGRVWFYRDVTEHTDEKRRLEKLHDATRRMMRAESRTEVATEAVHAYASILDMPMNTCWLYDEEEDVLSPVAWTEAAKELGNSPTPEPEPEPGDGISREVFESGEPSTFDDSTDSRAFNPNTAVKAEMILPLGEHGVINVGVPEAGVFDENDVSLAKLLAANVETAMTRADRETELRRQRRFVDQTLDAIDDIFYAFDTEGRPIHWNDAVSAVTGYDDEEVASMRALDFFDGESQERVAEAIDEVLETGHATVAVDLVTKDGSRIPYEFTGSVLNDTDGNPIGFTGVGRDVSDRRERERELERKNERLEAFTSMVSHDLRNPLEVAQGHAELARAESDSDHLDDLVDTHDRIAELIDDLLTLAKTDDPVGDVEPVSLGPLVRHCWETIDTETATLQVETDRVVEADERRLERIVTNLLANAVEHAPADRDDELVVTVGETEDGFYVADDGTGVAPEDRESVFDRGYSTGDESPGFGLEIVERLVEAHGWSISLDESGDGGARFEVHTTAPNATSSDGETNRSTADEPEAEDRETESKSTER